MSSENKITLNNCFGGSKESQPQLIFDFLEKWKRQLVDSKCKLIGHHNEIDLLISQIQGEISRLKAVLKPSTDLESLFSEFVTSRERIGRVQERMDQIKHSVMSSDRPMPRWKTEMLDFSPHFECAVLALLPGHLRTALKKSKSIDFGIRGALDIRKTRNGKIMFCPRFVNEEIRLPRGA